MPGSTSAQRPEELADFLCQKLRLFERRPKRGWLIYPGAGGLLAGRGHHRGFRRASPVTARKRCAALKAALAIRKGATCLSLRELLFRTHPG
jgi:hypothetical protein